MKKTLTVNLGGTVFHIDEDAYRLLDNYLCNLRLHFRKQEGAEEIVNDIENRISELFAEKLSAGSQVITIADVEEVIAPIFYTVPLQLLAYHVALIKGTDVDQPRNLAKSVTVE